MVGLFALLFAGLTSGIVFMPGCGGPTIETLQEAGLSHTGRGGWGLHA
jgi:hypothetical protein